MSITAITLADIDDMATWSNCFNVFGTDGTGAPTDAVPPRMVNALELSWNMPYAIPNDNTQCSLTC